MINSQQIQLVNPHWESSTPYEVREKWHRFAYSHLSSLVDLRTMISITGLRRVGKSTLMGQLREEHVARKKLSSKHHLFFSFEREDGVGLLPTSDLEDLMSYYFNQILSINPHQLSTDVLICLDEIQNVSSWQKVLKTYYDLSPHIKFIISGSSSLYLRESADSLVGRIIDYRLNPLCFGEFLQLAGQNELTTINSWDELITFPAVSTTAQRLLLFEKFLLFGGFPETALMFAKNVPGALIQKYIYDSIIFKIINKDFTKFFNLKVSEQDLLLFKVLCYESGQVLNLNTLAKETGFSLDAIKSHIKAFVASGLVKFLYRFDTKPRKIVKSHPKVYVTSPSLIMSYLGHSSIPAGSLIGHIAETYSYARMLDLISHDEIYFASPARDQEIDFYIPKQKTCLEVKYGDFVSSQSIDYLQNTAKKFKLKPIMLVKQQLPSLELPSIPLSYL